MPTCLDCDNTFKFSYTENSYNEAEYAADGTLQDVVYKEYYDVTDCKCMVCGSSNIEGKV
jgi:hypothetical protein